MSRQRKVRHLGALAVVLGALTMSGCALSGPIEDFPGVPLVVVPEEGEPVDEEAEPEEEAEPALEELDVPEGEITAIYLENGNHIAVVLWGSSSCPPVGSRLTVVDDAGSGNAVRLDVAEIPADRICTADFVPHTTVFGTPRSVTTTQPLLIDVDGEEVVLPIK